MPLKKLNEFSQDLRLGTLRIDMHNIQPQNSSEPPIENFRIPTINTPDSDSDNPMQSMKQYLNIVNLKKLDNGGKNTIELRR